MQVLRLFPTTTEQNASKEECLKWLVEVYTFAQVCKDWKNI